MFLLPGSCWDHKTPRIMSMIFFKEKQTREIGLIGKNKQTKKLVSLKNGHQTRALSRHKQKTLILIESFSNSLIIHKENTKQIKV